MVPENPGPSSGTGPEPSRTVPGSSGPHFGIVSESPGPGFGIISENSGTNFRNIRKYSEKRASPSLEKGKPGASPSPVTVTGTVTGSPLRAVTETGTVLAQGQPGAGVGLAQRVI